MPGVAVKDYLLKEIEPGSFFTKTVYLDRGFVVATPEMPFSKGLSEILEKWNFNKIKSGGEPLKDYTNVESTGKPDVVNSSIADLSLQSDADKLEQAEKFYTTMLNNVEKIFIRITISNELDYKNVTEKIKNIVEYI
jgi:hypothetical protein